MNVILFNQTEAHTQGLEEAITLYQTDCPKNKIPFDEETEALDMEKMNDDDLITITADHGNDPTAPGTDHTREYVPLLVYSKSLKGGELPIRETFADIGATISENFKTKKAKYGTSFFKELK